jgi:hypothetical protein
MINQLSFCRPNLATSSGPNVPMMDNSTRTCENVGVTMYLSLMGTFNIPPPISHFHSSLVYVISLVSIDSTTIECSSKMSYFEYSWVVPNPSILVEENIYT